ncbi:hypothetical protein LINPERPRIM_LOCUS29371, partial [Linum perenne]
MMFVVSLIPTFMFKLLCSKHMYELLLCIVLLCSKCIT